MLWGKPNREVLEELGEYVEGHTQAKKALITLVNRSKMRYRQRWGLAMHKDFLIPVSKVLLIGASGTGKTYLVESLNEIVPFPLVKIDATKMNPTGASGGVKEEDLRKMIVDNATREYQMYPKRYFSIDGAVDQTVVFVDEIDKLGASFDSSGKWNDHVQSNFLTLFDNKSEFSGVSFIFAGAFTNITGDRIKRKSMGFGSLENEIDENIENKIVDSGLLPELVGRITSIVQLDQFTEKEFYDILKRKILPKKQMDLAAFGVFGQDLTDEQMREIVKRAVKSDQGIRALQRELDKLYLDIEFNYEDNQQGLLL